MQRSPSLEPETSFRQGRGATPILKQGKQTVFGLLNLHKPAGITSRDVVNRVQRLVRPVKVGHAGTLDPLATGVLVLGLGPATRLVEYVQRLPKTYRAMFLFGRSSDTEDIAGQVVELADPPVPTHAALCGALSRFVGSIEQVPPAYSALKVAGRRAYDMARRGETVRLAPRTIEIYAAELLDYRYPEVQLRLQCGSGTYVRSLGRDLARALGSEAVMSALVREAIGNFSLNDALSCDQLSLELVRQHLLPATAGLGTLPRIELTAEEEARLRKGQAVANRWQLAAGEAAAIAPAGDLMAIVEAAQGSIRPDKCFPPT
ncbi:MAG: tRNA pseudouridine(55) synthase TruB [Pirellulaceae bacterium]